MTANICPAKRGDLALFELESSTTYVHGRTERTYAYLFAKVTSVTLGGNIKRAERPETMPWPWCLGNVKCWVVSRDKLNGRSADDMLARLPDHYPSVDAARDAMTAQLRAALADSFVSLVNDTEARVRAILSAPDREG